ncbi:MAG: YdcF family protein [Gammaproteobacteria bacterium]|nr:YdcF family protein [Gammaproteobacteria bacterium]
MTCPPLPPATTISAMESLFFWISKLAWAVIAPDMLLLWLFIIALLFLWWRRLSRWQAWGKRLLILYLLLIITITLIPIGELLLSPLERRFPINPQLPAQLDGIIVLSGAENGKATALWDQVILGEANERLHHFQLPAREHPQAKLVFSGGTGSLTEQRYKGSSVARRQLKELGFPVERVIFEGDSRNTVESILRLKALLHPEIHEQWLVITTAWHMPRTIGIFCNAAWPVIPFPVDYQTLPESIAIAPDFAGHLQDLNIAAKEWLGLLAYYLSGRSAALFPKSQAC